MRTRVRVVRVAAVLSVAAVPSVLSCGGSASNADAIAIPELPAGGGGTLGLDEPLGPSVPLGGDDPCPPQPLTLADTLAALLADVQTQPGASRPFLRYVSVGQFRPGPCDRDDELERVGRELSRARMAVSKVINGMSREPRAVVPEAVGPEGLLLRLDLRNYGWQRPVTLEGQSYDDAWQAVSARAGIALELQGGAASELSSELGTRMPVLLASAFVASAASGELYYAVLGLPATLAELKRELGIDSDEDLDRGPWARAAFSTSGVTQQPRGVARYRGTELGDGYFWQTFDYAPRARPEALYLEPLGTRADGHEVLFSLPNGLPAYFTTDGDGARLLESRFSIDPAQNNGRMHVSTSCVSCHNPGVIPVGDGVRSFVGENADLFSYATLERVRELYPATGEMEALVQADSQRIVAAAERAGQPESAPDPVSRIALEYQLALTFDRLAAELFLDRGSLIERLPSLPESLAAAATSGGLERSVFEALYLEAACSLYGAAESSPVGCP